MSIGDTAYSLWNAGYDACGYPKSTEKETAMAENKSDEADWADEIAYRLFDEFCSTDNIVESTAVALRKAKADGMRDAAAMLDGDGKWNCAPSSRFDDEAVRWAKHMREAASRVENTLGTLGETKEQIKAK